MESVVLETSMGDIQLELYWDHAPRVCFTYLHCPSLEKLNRCLGFQQTCKNFAELTRRGFYNGVVFHRIISVRSFPLTLRRLFDQCIIEWA